MAKIDTEPLAMKKIVTYQSEAIVSRTLLNRTGGTATMFAFDQGQALSEHTAPYDALVITIDGKAEIIISGNAYSIEEGQMIRLPANEPHAIKALTRFTMLLVMIRK
jgi:quercetin dioxygenase-like cupin family protein